MTSVTGNVIAEAQFDRKIIGWGRLVVTGFILITLVGIPLLPLRWIASYWYGAEHMRRVSPSLTSQALGIKMGVFFRKESTIPLNRITDLRLHDGPVMRHYGLRGLKVETAGMSGQDASSEGNLIGVIDAGEFRNAVLAQRQRVIDPETGWAQPASAEAPASVSETLAVVRDILTRIEAQISGRLDS